MLQKIRTKRVMHLSQTVHSGHVLLIKEKVELLKIKDNDTG